VSDTHLGSPACRAGALLAFLRAHPSDMTYLVGDIIDGWAIERRWHWEPVYNEVVNEVLARPNVVYIPGNHDEFLRRPGVALDGITFADSAIHVAADGRRVLVIHGDQFDGAVRLAKFGHAVYMAGTRVEGLLHTVTRLFGHFSLAAYLKRRVEDATAYFTAFANLAVAAARDVGATAVICGHVHRPEIREVDGVTYMNCGDWTEHNSAIVEHHDGRFEVVRG
jgi:UDP-2,3-diacylglucosamine pyrophosphatase LpxH